MENGLDKDWITKGWIDFEYKKYLLLAYLQYVHKHFDRIQLYPPMAELVDHYRDLQGFRTNLEQLDDSLRKELKEFDSAKLRVVYKDLLNDGDNLKVIHEIVQYALPQMKASIEEGKDLYELIEEQLEFEPIGLTPLYRDEGLLLLHDDRKEVHVYRYTMSRIISDRGRYRSLQTELLGMHQRKIGNPLENFRSTWNKMIPELNHPAVYSVFSKMRVPFRETLVPIAKRLLMKELNQQAA